MPSPKTLLAIAVPWLGTLVAAFWFGKKSAPEVVIERDVVRVREVPVELYREDWNL